VKLDISATNDPDMRVESKHLMMAWHSRNMVSYLEYLQFRTLLDEEVAHTLCALKEAPDFWKGFWPASFLEANMDL
jgi:hypothetical protein